MTNVGKRRGKGAEKQSHKTEQIKYDRERADFLESCRIGAALWREA
jgi:hypothetical protein